MDSSPNPGINKDDDCVTPDNRGKRKETPNADTSKPTSSRKLPNPRSSVWSHFSRLKEDRNKCSCHYCKKELSCLGTSGTSNLHGHLAKCTPYQTWLDGERQKVINRDGNLTIAKVSESIFREATNELMVLSQLPLSFIEGIGWKHFCDKVHLYKPISRRTSTRDIIEMYVNRKTALKNWMSKHKKRVSLTTDIWVSQTTGASYMVITAHFIDENWELKKLIIGFKYVTDHKGQTISNILLECLAEWGIEKVFCITVDNATANSNAIRNFHKEFSLISDESLVLDGNFLHMRCSAHIINLVARDGLAELGDSVLAIRNAIQYVRSSTPRLKSFELKVDSGNLSRGSLPMDVKTRWNSTFLMLSRAIQFKLAFNKMEAEDKLYNDYFLEFENGKKRCGPPVTKDWQSVERLVKFLVVFYNSTLVVSASTTCNSYKCYGEIVTIERALESLGDSLDAELRIKSREMLDKFHKYWDGVKNINKMLIIATVLDPRKKLNFSKLCFEKLYGRDSSESRELYDSVFDLLGCMFKEYKSRFYKGQENVQASSSTQTQVCTQEPVSDRMDFVYEGFNYETMDFVYKEFVDETGVQDTRDELEIYLKEPVENPKVLLGTKFNVLSWWRMHNTKFPVLAEMARDVLAMQVSSVASESAFSTSGRVLDPYRSRLTHYMIEVLICTEQWMKAEIRLTETTIITNEEMLAEVELLDKLERLFKYPSSQTD